MTDRVEELIRQYSLAEPRRAAGGLRALSGFRYQLLAHLSQFVKEVIDRNAPPDEFAGLSEFLSDFSSNDHGTLSLVQCKTTLTRSAMRQAAAEFVHIENFLQSTGAPEDRLTPQFKLFFQRTNEAVIPHWDTIEPALRQSTSSLLAIWQDLVNAGKIDPPECKADPLFDLTKNLKTIADDPFAVRAELVEVALSRGNNSASKLRDELWKVVERARSQHGSTDCFYLDHQDFSPLQRDRALRVGSSPTLSQLRKGQYFERRDRVSRGELALKSADFTTNELSIFWIAGRSGSGKSALLLQLMQAVVANGDLVAYPHEGATSLLDIFRKWPKVLECSGAPRYLFVDDLYAPNVRDQLSLDSIQSLVMADGQHCWPIIVTCGPTEFKNALQRDFGGKPLKIESWELQPIDVSERENFIRWFEETTGATAKRGRAANQSDALMISLAHELRYGELGQFATRFADRLAASGLTNSIRIVLAVNRLYIEAPRSWLTTEEWLRLDELNNDGDFSISSNEVANEAFIRLAHPYITDAIYRKVRQPQTALACSTDIGEAFSRCMEKESDINSRVGRRILAAVACGETHIDIDEAFLAAQFAEIWTTNADKVCESNPYARADFWFSWCQWDHRQPELKLADRIGKIPIVETLAAVVDAHVLRHTILARLQELFPNDYRVRSAAKEFLVDGNREDDNGWGFIWEQLLHTATENETQELLRIGQDWASKHMHSKSWPRVAQELLQLHNRERLQNEDALVSLVDLWLSKFPISRSWNFVFGVRLEFAHAAKAQRGFVEKSGTDWLRQHPNHPDWSFVWRKLYGFADDAQATVLSQLAVTWLGHSLPNRGWTYVCEAVANCSVLSEESLRSLAKTASDWLAEFPQSESWGNAWAAFFTVQLRLGDLDDAIDLGAEWLLVSQGRSSWQYTLCEFIRLSNDHTAIKLPIVELAVDWSIENSRSENTSKVLRRILKVGGIKENETLRSKVREACIQWLRFEAHLPSFHWPRVFLSANRVFGDEAFCDIGVAWLQSNETSSDWEGVALAILRSAEEFASRQDFARLLSRRLQSDRAFIVSLRAAKKLGNSELDDVPELLKTLERRHERLREIKNAINAKRPVVYQATIVKTIAKQDRELVVVDVGVPAYLDMVESEIQHRVQIGTKISVSPTKCDPKTGIVWVSTSRALTTQRRQGFVASVDVGDIVEGRVCHRSLNFVLVSVRDVTIYVRRDELAWRHPPPDPITEIEDGEEVLVKVTRVDNEKLNVSGSIRQAGSHPFEDGRVSEGMTVLGVVIAIKHFGAIVALPQGVTGLLHQSEIFSRKRGRYYPAVKSVLSVDQKVDVRIRSFDVETNRVELALSGGPAFG